MLTSKRFLIVLCLALLITSSSTLTAAPYGSTIVNDKITVPAGSFAYYRFVVPQGWSFGTVAGRFRAEGGRGNDIEVFIIDEDGFENFRNRHQVGTYYNSGRVTVANVRVSLRPQVYYLIFNNAYSLFTNKVVAATIELHKAND
ncbi:MAG TPA: hypothetical protein VNI02_01555 [Blastocatellia bacterium]|jgi:hypothetical protein|nr:hypothetical protein [Blastocatellia bacterium]